MQVDYWIDFYDYLFKEYKFIKVYFLKGSKHTFVPDIFRVLAVQLPDLTQTQLAHTQA